MPNMYDPDPIWDSWMANEARYAAECSEDRHLGWDGQPVFQIHWLLSARPEQPLALDEFLEVWGDEPGMSEFVNDEPRIGAAQEFDVGCNSNLRVTRVA